MTKKYKTLSLRTTAFWKNTFSGILWVGVGISGMFRNSVCEIMHIALLASVLFIGIILSAFAVASKIDKNDEMADYNYIKARATASGVMYFFYCIGAIASALIFGLMKNADISWPRIISNMFFIVLGIQDIVIGIIFRRLEAE